MFSWQVSWYQLGLEPQSCVVLVTGESKSRVHLLLAGYLPVACEQCSLLRRALRVAGHPGCLGGISFSIPSAILADCYFGEYMSSETLMHQLNLGNCLPVCA